MSIKFMPFKSLMYTREDSVDRARFLLLNLAPKAV